MNEDLTSFILKELSKHRNCKDIVQKIREHAGLPERDAERLLTLVEARRRRMLEQRRPQTPWLLFLSIGVLLLGIGLLGFNLQSILMFFQKDVLSQAVSLRTNSYQVIGLITGSGMTVGGMIGLWKSFGIIFPE